MHTEQKLGSYLNIIEPLVEALENTDNWPDNWEGRWLGRQKAGIEGVPECILRAQFASHQREVPKLVTFIR
jgi:hypothetical protein